MNSNRQARFLDNRFTDEYFRVDLDPFFHSTTVNIRSALSP